MGISTPSTNDILEAAYESLRKIYKIAQKRQDLETMLKVAEKMMDLYGGMAEIKRHDREKAYPAGFTRVGIEDD